ncbi:MAG: response regulator transcription factor [Pyrinomonadaceae bacterium]
MNPQLKSASATPLTSTIFLGLKATSSPQPRILYVEDDADSGEMLCALFKFSRIEVTTAATADQAFRLMGEQRFDLYLLDTSLPGLDGFELCRQMRASDSSTPILFYSGAGYEADKEKGIDAGANDYLVKPDVEGLLGSVTRFVFPGSAAA